MITRPQRSLSSHFLLTGDTLTLKADSVRSFNQDYSRAGSGSETIQSADSPPEVTALLSGPETIPSCGYVRMDARKSTGSGARALTYSWSVSSSGSTTSVDSTLSDANGKTASIVGIPIMKTRLN